MATIVKSHIKFHVNKNFESYGLISLWFRTSPFEN